MTLKQVKKDLQDILRECYGSANRATGELLTPRENYRKYSAYGAALCKAQLLAQIAMLEQETMQIARRRLEQIQENQDEDAPKLNRDSQNLLERFDKLDDMKNELSDADFLLLEKIKDIFAERFEDISAAVENFTGRPL